MAAKFYDDDARKPIAEIKAATAINYALDMWQEYHYVWTRATYPGEDRNLARRAERRRDAAEDRYHELEHMHALDFALLLKKLDTNN